MNYCTQDDYSSRYGATELLQLTDRDKDQVADAGVFDNAAADAAATIDSYLGASGRYALPLQSPPQVLVRYAIDLTRYFLFGQRASQEVLDRYNQAMSWLSDLSKGIVSLGIDPPPAASTAGDNVLVNAGRRKFDDCSLNDYTHPGQRR